MKLNTARLTKTKLDLATKLNSLRRTEQKAKGNRAETMFRSLRSRVKTYRVLRLLTGALAAILILILLVAIAAPGELFYSIKKKAESYLSLSAEQTVLARLGEYQAVSLNGNCVQILLTRDQVLVGLQRLVAEKGALSEVYEALSSSDFAQNDCDTTLPVVELRFALSLMAGSRGEQTGTMYEREVAERKVRIQSRYNSIAESDVDVDLLIFVSNLFSTIPTDFDQALSQTLLREIALKKLANPDETNIPDEMYRFTSAICLLAPDINPCEPAIIASEFAQMDAENDAVLQLSHSEQLFNNFISALSDNGGEN
ncbi:hypothetical protein KC640_02735 [Candidatus Dojkabacteria bacterium]|uniref:Uncharacterized protein n=1 Tax=Candidatus Dojkabacteria bacterium TaxID=2099670 RepID=A0A955I5J2_9BACT|nr:hypothetical protein [Candidatus Dojkabacteria bacterium]